MQRNIVLKQFRGIPLADLEMVMPEKQVDYSTTMVLLWYCWDMTVVLCSSCSDCGLEMVMPEKQVGMVVLRCCCYNCINRHRYCRKSGQV